MVNLIDINAKRLTCECISAIEYVPKIFHLKVNNRKNSSFLYILEGEYRYNYSNGRFTAKKGDIVYLPRKSTYKYDVKTANAKCMQIEFNSYYDGEACSFALCPMVAIEDADSLCKEIFSKTIYLQTTDPKNESIKTTANMFTLLGLFQDKLKGINSSSSYKKILPAIDYIKQNFTDKIYVEQLASLCNLSASQVRRIFKKELGLCPIDYKNKIVEDAAKLLIRGDNTIGEIAENLGFDNIYAFSQFFKKRFGVSPTAFRESKMH